jgi:hypothetical protein
MLRQPHPVRAISSIANLVSGSGLPPEDEQRCKAVSRYFFCQTHVLLQSGLCFRRSGRLNSRNVFEAMLFARSLCDWIALFGGGLATSTSPMLQKCVIKRQIRSRSGIAAGIVGSSLHRRIFQGE